MTNHQCLNCAGAISENQKFCANCGQKTDIHRFTLGYIFHEFIHAFTHADKGIFFLMKQLTIKPGVVISEYVDGKRKKYFNPFTFFFLIMTFFVFMNTYLSPYAKPADPDPKILAQIHGEKNRQAYLLVAKRSATVSAITIKNGNIVAMVSLPFSAFIVWLFFRKRGRNFSEILTANFFLIAFTTFVFSLCITPLLAATVGKPVYYVILTGGFLLQSIYYGWGFRRFFNMKYKWEIIKTWSVNVVAVFSWGIITSFLAFWYITGSNFSKIAGSMIKKLFQ